MLILIVLLPLLGFISGSLLGLYLGLGVCFITTFSIFSSFCLSLILFYDVLSNGQIHQVIMGSWFLVESLCIEWGFFFDSLTCVMLLVVTFISTLVHLYFIWSIIDFGLNRHGIVGAWLFFVLIFRFFVLVYGSLIMSNLED